MTTNLIMLTDPTSPAAEAYRRLRVNLISAGREAPLRTILVAAAAADTDKASVVANLAVAWARADKQVIVADCDLRHPALHTLFGLDNSAGVTTAVQDDGALPLQATGVAGLRVLTSGPAVAVPSDLMASAGMRRLLDRLAREADVVLLDAPPVTLATDAAELAMLVDGVLLVVTAGQTRRDEAQRARELLVQVGARVVGAALVNVAPDVQLRKYLAKR
ncbi:MAG: CpsD/CapB family tyrosine-protein kinase [Anaerolineae bacterium]